MAKCLWLGGLILLIVARAPLLPALDCSHVSSANYNLCMEIKNSNLTEIEQNLIISNLDYSKKFFPDNDFVYRNNIGIYTNNSPTGISVYNGLFIKNAWLSIFALMPSVIYNNQLYVPNQTTVLSGFNYQIQIPSDYYSSGYPSTNGGDCRRNYHLSKNDSENKVYVNNLYQGSGRLVNATITSDSLITADYVISTEVSIDHYSWNKYCCSYKNKKCVKYCYDCRLSYNEKKPDSVDLFDQINISYYHQPLFADLKVLDSVDGTTKFNFNYSDSAELSFKYSNFTFYKFVYSINYSKEPYNVYTLKAEDYNQQSIYNVLINGKDFLVNNFDECNIKAFNFFESFEKSCSLEYQNLTFYITTDKLIYQPGETIQVSIFPSNITVEIIYGNITYNASGSQIFTANLFENKISAEYSSLSAQKIIFVSDGHDFDLLFKLILIFLLIFLIYSYLSRKWRKVS